MPDPESHPEKDLLTVEPLASRPTSARTGPSGMETNLKVTLDERQRTMEGFRTLGVIAIFLAGLQAQMLSISIQRIGITLSGKLVNAFWLGGIFFDVFGAVLATLTARWLQVLHPHDVEFLNDTWATAKADVPLPTPEQSKWHRKGLIEHLVATALFSAFGVVGTGVALFFVGLMIYIWAEQPLLVSVIATIPFALLTLLVGCLFIPHEGGKRDIIEILAWRKGSW